MPPDPASPQAPVRETGRLRARVADLERVVAERRRAEAALREGERRYAELYEAAQRQARELALLNRVGAAVARELDLPTVFRTVIEAIAAAFGYTHVGAYRREGDELVLQHQVDYDRVEELRRLGCDHGQGYYFAKPLTPDAVAALLAAASGAAPSAP